MPVMNHFAWTDWHAQLHQMLKVRDLLPCHSRILIAASGGQDSLCLLQLLADLQPRWHWQLGVVHCNHRWRMDADANAEFVRSLAQAHQLPIWIETADIPPSGEAAARQWRYDCFTNLATAQGFDIVVTGHTQTDRAETLLYNLMRGSGADGLQSLTWRRSLMPTIQLVRPLLEFSRSATAQFCQTQAIAIWADSTNDDLTYARNRLRHEVLPYLTQHFNPQTTAHLAQTAELLQADVAYLEAQTEPLYHQAIDPANPTQIDRRVLQSQPLALQRRVVRRFLRSQLNQAPNFEQIEAVVGLITAPNRSQTSTFPGGTIVRVSHPHLQLCRP
jgi:tRNA(Ile)-lysidine synthase